MCSLSFLVLLVPRQVNYTQQTQEAHSLYSPRPFVSESTNAARPKPEHAA